MMNAVRYFLRKRPDRIAENLSALLAQDLFARPETYIRNLELGPGIRVLAAVRPDVVVKDLSSAPAISHLIDGKICGDPVDPSRELVDITIARDIFIYSKKSLLTEVDRYIVVADHDIEIVGDRVLVLGNQLGEGSFVPGYKLTNQIVVCARAGLIKPYLKSL